MREIKKLAGETLIYGLGTMIPRLLNYIILTPYFTYTLFKHAQEEFGKVTELYAYIAFLMIVLTYGMETTYFRFVNTEKDNKKVYSTILTSLIVTSVFFFMFVFVFTDPISSGLKYSGETIFIRLLGGILAVEAISAIPFAKLRVQNRAKRFALLKFIHIVLNISIMLGVYNFIPKIIGSSNYLLNDFGVVSSRFIFISNLLASSFILVLLLPEFKDYSFSKFDLKLLKPLLIYGLPLMASGLAGTVNETLDRSIYRHIISDSHQALKELGVYGANYKIGGLVLIFIQMFRYAAEPYFFNKAKDLDSKEQYSQLMNLFVGFIISLGLFVLLFLNYFKYFISQPYHIGLFIVPYIVLAYVMYGILFNLSIWYKLSNKTHYAFIIMVIGAFITIAINIIFIPTYRYAACAIGHICSYGVMILISYFLGRKYFKVKYNLSRILVYFLLGFFIYFFVKLLPEYPWAIDIAIKSIILLLFVTFVAWKEGMLKYLIRIKR